MKRFADKKYKIVIGIVDIVITIIINQSTPPYIVMITTKLSSLDHSSTFVVVPILRYKLK